MIIKRNVFMVFALAAAIAPIPSAAQNYVRNFDELCKIAENLGGSYVLDTNITVTKKEITDKFGADGFKPIGTEKTPFTGTFRGKDKKTYVIRGLHIDRPGESNVGLFGYVGKGAEISNIGVVTDSIGITGDYSVGVLAGTNKGRIENCYSAGVVAASGRSQRESSAGGLVGFNGGAIDKSYSSASVNGYQYVGGLAGFLTVDPSGRVTESYAAGEIEGTTNAGGLVGYIFDGSIEKCFSTVKVVGIGEQGIVGGLVGGDFGSSNTAWNVRGKNGAGGYVKDAVKISNSFWDKNTFGVPTTVDVKGGEEKTSEEMKNPKTFEAWGEDFKSTWSIAEGSSHPQLQAMEEAALCALTYRAGFNGTLRVGGAYVPADSAYVVILEEGSRAPEVEAIPDGNYKFTGWTDDIDTTVRADIASKTTRVNVTALFSLNDNTPMCRLTYKIEDGQEKLGSLRVSAKGMVMEDLSKYSMTVIQGVSGFEVTAVPAKGCAFAGWTDCESGSCEKDSARADVPRKDAVFTAMFVKTAADPEPGVNYYNLFYSSGANGQLRVGGKSGLQNLNLEEQLKEGTRGAVVAAFPNSGFRFLKWNDGVTTLARSDTAKPGAHFLASFERAPEDTIMVTNENFNMLQEIGNNSGYPPDGFYILTEDIVFNASDGKGFKPIGGEDNPFTGVFDGNGKKISGLSINRPDENFTGLFGCAKNARISRVYLASVSVTGGNNTGALAGSCLNTAIDSCEVDGDVTGAGGAGGLVGIAVNSLISRSYSAASVSGKDGTGGLAGIARESMITHCYAARDGQDGVSGNAGAGGLIGLADGGAAQYSYAVIRTQGASAAGGFVGGASRGAAFYHCYSAGYVDGAGGFAGTAGGGAAAYLCYWDTEISELESSPLGTGKESAAMKFSSSYADGGERWDFLNVWSVNEQWSYPYLREIEPKVYPGIYKSKQLSTRRADKRLARVRGRVMTINAPHGVVWQVRLIDMRGRTVARYNTQNGNKISLNKLSSGKYMIEARDRGKRVDVQGVVLR